MYWPFAKTSTSVRQARIHPASVPMVHSEFVRRESASEKLLTLAEATVKLPIADAQVDASPPLPKRLGSDLPELILPEAFSATGERVEEHAAADGEAVARVRIIDLLDPEQHAVQAVPPADRGATRLEDFDLVLYDLETTGRSRQKNAICEIWAQRMRFAHGAWRREGPPLDMLVHPGMRIPQSATKVHHLKEG
jgi:hypothetical protein